MNSARSWLPALGTGLALTLLACDPASQTAEVTAEVAEPAASHSGDTAPESGRWNRTEPSHNAPDAALQRDIEALDAIGYLDGSAPLPSHTGVLTSRRGRVAAGLNFYLSGHAAEAILMDSTGLVRHRWTIDYESVWGFPATDLNRNTHYWRHAELLPDGDLLAIHEGMGLLRIDRDSKLLWAHVNRAHHDLFVADDSDIYVLTREPHIVPRIHPTRPILEDFISVLGPDGVVKRRVSLLEAFERSDFAHHLERAAPSGDLFHTNSIELFDGSQAHRSPLFARNNALVSLRNLDLLAIVDLKTERIVWAATGDWKRQHKASLLDSGHILLFDNQGNAGRSRVLEINPLTGERIWSYPGDDAGVLYSETAGSCQRLRNRNTLITESEQGRAIEVTPQGEIVWEFISPHRAGDENQWVATLFDLVRIEDVAEWSWLAPVD